MSTEQCLIETRSEVQRMLQQQQQQLPQAPPAQRLHDPDFVVQPRKRLAMLLVLIEDVLLFPHIKTSVANLKALAQLAVKVNELCAGCGKHRQHLLFPGVFIKTRTIYGFIHRLSGSAKPH